MSLVFKRGVGMPVQLSDPADHLRTYHCCHHFRSFHLSAMSPSTSRHTLSTVLHACLFVACLTVAMVDAQNYHFSNGWHPGGKRSTQNDCLFRPQIKLLIEKLIEDEVTRIQSTCSGPSHSISDVPSYLQSKKESTWPLDTDQD